MRYLLTLVCLATVLAGCDNVVDNDPPDSSRGFTDMQFEEVLIEQISPPNVETGVSYGKVSLQLLEATGGPEDVVDRINAVITRKTVGGSSYEAFIEDFLPDENFIPDWFSPRYTATVSVARRYPNMVSLRITTFNSKHCGASCSGAYRIQYANFDEYGRLLELSDVISDTDAFFDRTNEAISPYALYWGIHPGRYFLPPNWYITQNGDASYITLQFQAYDISVGAAGAIRLSFGLNLFDDLLMPRFWTKSYGDQALISSDREDVWVDG